MQRATVDYKSKLRDKKKSDETTRRERKERLLEMYDEEYVQLVSKNSIRHYRVYPEEVVLEYQDEMMYSQLVPPANEEEDYDFETDEENVEWGINENMRLLKKDLENMKKDQEMRRKKGKVVAMTATKTGRLVVIQTPIKP